MTDHKKDVHLNNILDLAYSSVSESQIGVENLEKYIYDQKYKIIDLERKIARKDVLIKDLLEDKGCEECPQCGTTEFLCGHNKKE